MNSRFSLRIAWWCVLLLLGKSSFVHLLADQKTTGPPLTSTLQLTSANESSIADPRVAIRAFWVDEKGTLLKDVPIERVAWVWRKRDVRDERMLPALRVWINTKLEGIKRIQSLLAKNAWVAERMQSPEDFLVLDLKQKRVDVHFKLLKKSGKRIESTLAVLVNLDQPLFVAHPNCKRVDYRFEHESGDSKNLFLALDCAGSEKSRKFFVFKSDDAKWNEKRSLASGTGREKSFVAAEAKAKVSPLGVKFNKITEVSVLDLEDQSANYTLYSKAVPRPVVPISLGLTSIYYTQTGYSKYSAITSTVKAAYGFPLPWKNWDIGMNGYFTAYTLTSNEPEADLRFLGLNLRIGYTFHLGTGWSFGLSPGIFYSTMFGNTEIGFSNLLYPQIFPILKRKFSKQNSGFLYGKYVPISDSIKLTMDQREIATGVGLSHVLKNGHPIMFNLDYSNIRVNLGARSQIQSNSLSASVGYGL